MQWAKNMCRLCGQIGENPHVIYASENLVEKIKKCLNLEIYKEDFKPKQVCKSCFIKLDDFSTFIDVCYATNLKLESVYYTEPWHNDERNLYEHLNAPKQSVIVSNSNRQCNDNTQQFYRQSSSQESMTILPSYTLNQSEDMLGFSLNYNNIQQNDIHNNCFIEPDSIDKQEVNTAVDTYRQSKETTNSYLVNENNPLDCLDIASNHGSDIENIGHVLKKGLVSVKDVRKTVEAEKLVEPRHCNSTTKKSYSCPHCEKIFMRRSNLNAHISVHTKIRPYKCSSCSKNFAVKCHLTQHKKIHLDIFVCPICHKKFDVPSKLTRHVLTHGKDKPFACTFSDCKKSFSDKNNLKQHSLLHSSVKNFCCVICTKEFKSKKNLTAHVRSHVSNGTFQCQFCQKMFKYKHNLKTHLVKHFNQTEIKD